MIVNFCVCDFNFFDFSLMKYSFFLLPSSITSISPITNSQSLVLPNITTKSLICWRYRDKTLFLVSFIIYLLSVTFKVTIFFFNYNSLVYSSIILKILILSVYRTLERGNKMVKTKKVFSKTLAALDILGVPYIVKGRNAQLVDHDSLQITLEGEYKDAWFRWSTKEGGRGVDTLVTYLMKQGIVDKKAALNFLGGKTNGKSYKLKEVDLKIAEDSNFDEIVYDPNAWQTKEYLIDERKLNEMLVDVVFKRGLILENASGNLVFLQLDKDGNRIGAEVIGTHPDKDGNRIRLNMPGSKGFFYILGKDCDSLKDVERIVFCEGVIDLLSYVELIGYSDSVRDKIPYNIPKSESKTMYVAIGGSLTKVERIIEQLTTGFGLNLKELHLIIATDNDEAGNKAYDLFKEHFPDSIREKPDSRTVPVKDWNDLLKLIKKGSDSDE